MSTITVRTRGTVQEIEPEAWQAFADEWMRSYVSPYFLPKRVRAAQKRQAAKVSVPVETLEALIGRVAAARAKGSANAQIGVGNLITLLNEAGVAA